MPSHKLRDTARKTELLYLQLLMILTDRQKMKSEQEKKAWLPITIQNGGVRTFKDNFKEARLLFKVLKGGQHIHFIFGDKKSYDLWSMLYLKNATDAGNEVKYF